MKNAVIVCLAAVSMLLSARPEARTPARYRSVTSLRIVPAARTEVGVATWYGGESSGTTATGEIYDMNGFTAAHRTLPLNSRIKVTNLRNGRSLVLRVNDRGPNVVGRLLDVSEAAAERLGFIDSGKVPVRLTVVRYPARYVAEPDVRVVLASCPVAAD